MDELDDQGHRLLEWLVGKLATAVPGDPRTYVSYRDAHDELGLEMRGTTDGISLQGQGLNSLAEWTKAAKKPGITGLIINRESLEPGPGYFKLFNKKQTDYPWWEKQIRLSKEFDWSPFLGSTAKAEPPAPKGKAAPPPPPPAPSTPEASDLQPPPRVEMTTYRVLRDSEVARRVKEMYGYACQVCGHVLRLPDGKLYAEAHHIQPLGGDHKGHDVPENVLCVCPNHHAELDLGLWDIEVKKLRVVAGHKIGPEYVRHHNTVVRKRWKS